MLICVGSQSEGYKQCQMIENGLLFFFSNNILILFLTFTTFKTVFCIGILVDSITVGMLRSTEDLQALL